MVEKIEQKFSSPEEEIAFLRRQIAEQERDLLERAPEADVNDIEQVAKTQIHEYGTFTPNMVLDKEHQMSPREVTASAQHVEGSTSPVEEIVRVAEERGIHNALQVMEKANSAFTTDEVHRQLIEMIKEGKQVADLKEGVPPWHILHMTLFEVSLPEFKDKDGSEPQLSELIGLMEQFYAGMQAVGLNKKHEHYAIEIAVAEGSEDIIFYIAIPNDYIDLFEKQVLSLYPDAQITEQKHDYNIFVEGGVSEVSVGTLAKHHIYPLKTKEEFESDPLAVLLNAFSKIEKEGGGAAIQIVVKSSPQKYLSTYEGIIRRARDGMKAREAISRASITGELFALSKEMLKSAKDDKDDYKKDETDQDAIEAFNQKIASPILEANIRIAASATNATRASQILSDIEATFYQFENTRGNRLQFDQ